MNPSRHMLAVLCCLGWFLIPGPLLAQEPDAATVVPAEAQGTRPASDPALWAQRLGVELDALDDPVGVAELAAQRRAAAVAFRDKLAGAQASLVSAQDSLRRLEAAEPTGSATLQKLGAVRRRVAKNRVTQITAARDALEAASADADADAAWLDAQKARLEAEARRRAKEAADAARLREEARKAEAEATETSQQKLEEIALAEQEVLDAKDARSRKRVELATKRAAVARETYYIVERRKALVRQLESEGAAGAALADWKAKVAARSQAVVAEADDPTEGSQGGEDEAPEHADQLYLELDRRRADARQRIVRLTPPLTAAERNLASAREGDAGAIQERSEDAGDAELARVRALLAAALRERQREHVKLLELRRDLAERALDRAYTEFRVARRAQSGLVPYLPAAHRAELRALNNPNVTGVVGEFQDFWIEVEDEWRTHVQLVVELPSRLFSVEGFLWLGKFGLFALLVVVAVRLVHSRREGFTTEATRFVLDHNLLRLPPRIVVKFFELFQAVVGDAVALAGAIWLLDTLPGGFPLVVLTQAVVFAVYVYRIGSTTVETLMLPRWYRENTDRDKWGSATPIDIGGDGVDLFDLELERAQFAVGTVRVLLIYTVICQGTVWLARATLGEFFLTFWVQVAGWLGYAIVIYALLSLWKETIARQFTRLDGGQDTATEGFVARHKDRVWGVIVIFGALAVVASRGFVAWAAKYLQGLELTRKLGSFVLRKRIEREAGVNAVRKAPVTDSLPPALLAAFAETPEASAGHLAPRPEAAVIADRLARFLSGKDGSVAVVGEQGMGKTTLLAEVAEATRAAGLPVVSTALDHKLLTKAEIVGFLAGTCGVEPERYTVAPLVRAILDGPRRAVVVDDCHHTFLRTVEGFAALEALLEIVSLTNHHVFWVLAFDELSWTYMDRFRSWGARVAVVKLSGLPDDGIRRVIEGRVAASGFGVSFDNLVVSHGGQDRGYQVVESAAGYFRLLTEFSEGNPRIAVRYWLRSVSVGDDGLLHVSLFDTESVVSIGALRSDEGFALAAVIQHDTLDALELARVLAVEVEIGALYLNAWRERGIIRVDPVTGRARALSDQLRQLRRQLAEIHFLYGA